MKTMPKAPKPKALLCQLLAVLLFSASPLTTYATEAEEQEEPLFAPYFVIQGTGEEDEPVDFFPLKSTDVITNINGVIAETYVSQTYTNQGDEPINARYVFPTAPDVTVHGMKMEIGNQIVTARIKEKEEAKEEFETAKSEGKSASLLEQKRPNVFTMDVANIMPGDTARIELHYTQLITPTEGIYEFVFPTVVGPRYAAPPAANTDASSDIETAGDTSSAPAPNEDSDNNSRENQSTDSNDTTENETDTNRNYTILRHTRYVRSDNNRNDRINLLAEEVHVSPEDSSDNENEGNSHDAPAEGNSNDNSGSASDENPDDWAASPYLPDGTVPPGEYHITVNLSTGVPLADLSCKTHDIDIAMDGDSKARVTLANPEDYAGNRDFILKYKLTGEAVQSGLVLTQGEKENYFMLTIQPPEHYTPQEIPPREYIFVLDVSGSMYGYPLDTAKKLIHDMAEGLREDDTFNLILFANDTILFSDASLPATPENIKAAVNLVDEQKGGGGTSLLPALKDAIHTPKTENTARSIILITDGYITNEEEILTTIDKNMDSASFFPFGIGDSVNSYLIKGIASAGMGEAFIITDSEDAEESARRFRTYIESPLLTDIKIDFEHFDIYDVEPSTPSILYAQKPIVLFGKWNGSPSGTITISGKSGAQDYLQEIPIADVTIDTQNTALRYLWARTRLDRLAGFGSTRNDSSIKEEITQLGLEYNMTTPYTSFIAVVDTIRNTKGNSTDVDQALPLPLHVTNLAVGGGYTAYSEPGEILFVLFLAGMAMMGLWKTWNTARRNKKHHQSM